MIFTQQKIGKILNPLQTNLPRNLEPKFKSVTIQFPCRLGAMSLDPEKITANQDMVFRAGQILFSVKFYTKATVSFLDKKGDEIIIGDESKRKTIIEHTALMMKKVLGIQHCLFIDVKNQNEKRHYGLGSSGSLIGAVASGINELYGCPISNKDLARFLAHNYCEEIDGNNEHVQQVQSIGGSTANGLFSGGLLLIAGEAQVVKSMKIDNSYKVVIGTPNDYPDRDAFTLIKEEENNLSGFATAGKKYGQEIAYRVVHEVLPAMESGEVKPIGDLIFDYRFHMGSIVNCSFTYPPIIEIAKKLSNLKHSGIAEVLSLSSVGPAFFALTKLPEICVEEFEKIGLNVKVVSIENSKYKVTRRVRL